MDGKRDSIADLEENYKLETQAPHEEHAPLNAYTEAYNQRTHYGKNYSGHISPLRLMVIATTLIFLYFCSLHVFPKFKIDPLDQQFQSLVRANGGNGTVKVPLEAHIMTKCPDAKDCLRDLIVPAMEKIYDKVNFTLSFIGTIDDSDQITCKHGETECLGNILSLCAASIYHNSTIIPLGFTTCLVSSYSRIPERSLVESCAMEHGVDFERLNDCVSEEGKGLDLLEQSVKRSQEAGVQKSCTVRVAGKIWCIRDGGVWIECSEGSLVGDLVDKVERLSNGTGGM